MMEALVPPKPNELESTVRILAGRASLATILRSSDSSVSRKLMFGGRNCFAQGEQADDRFDRARRA